MQLSVQLLYRPTDESLAKLRTKLHPDVRLDLGEIPPGEADYHVIVGGRPKRHHLTASPDVRAVIIPWAGLPDETRVLMRDFPHITVHNLHHNALPVAELAFALLLAASKFIVAFDHALRRHDWTPRYQPTPAILLAGKTALILGYGAIGEAVARLCHAFGMHVLATRRQVKSAYQDGFARVHPYIDMPELLPRAQALIICLPLTEETRGLIGEKELATLPSEAVLVNIGRGPIVDETALYRALSCGQLHAAGLDVWYNYPGDGEHGSRTNTPPANHPFHELKNVVMSPHRGGASDDTNTLRMEHLARLLNAAAAGDPIPNRVNLGEGY